MASINKKNPNPTDVYVGSRVRMRRLNLGMSQEKLGEALGLTFQQVQKYEKGMNRIGSSRLQQISNTLGVPVSWFFEGAPGGNGGGKKISNNDAVYTEFIAKHKGMKLMESWARLEDRERLAIGAAVMVLAKGRK